MLDSKISSRGGLKITCWNPCDPFRYFVVLWIGHSFVLCQIPRIARASKIKFKFSFPGSWPTFGAVCLPCWIFWCVRVCNILGGQFCVRIHILELRRNSFRVCPRNGGTINPWTHCAAKVVCLLSFGVPLICGSREESQQVSAQKQFETKCLTRPHQDTLMWAHQVVRVPHLRVNRFVNAQSHRFEEYPIWFREYCCTFNVCKRICIPLPSQIHKVRHNEDFTWICSYCSFADIHQNHPALNWQVVDRVKHCWGFIQIGIKPCLDRTPWRENT